MKLKLKLILLVLFLIVFFLLYNIFYKNIIFFKLGDEMLIDTERRSIRIFCMILTTSNSIDRKAFIINKTWAKDCDKYFFIAVMNSSLSIFESHEFYNPIPILQPTYHNAENYGKLTDKVFKTLRDVYLRYNNYDWYLKTDDDTFVFISNLKLFLKNKNSSKPVTYGHDFKILVKDGYHSGGAGYVLSNEAIKRLGKKLDEDYNFCFNTGFEDVDVANCLRKLSVYPEKSIDNYGRERFHPFDITTHFYGNFPVSYDSYAANIIKTNYECCSESSISFHYMKPDSIEKLYNLWIESKMNNNFTKILNQIISKHQIP